MPDRAMATWSEFESAEPEFAARVKALMSSRRHLTIATLRRSGAPRISGSEVELARSPACTHAFRLGEACWGVQFHPEVTQTQLDGWIVDSEDPPPDHPAGWVGEAKIAGTARAVDSGSAAHRFLIDIDEAVITHLNEAGNLLVVESWNSRRGYRKMERE